MDAIARRKLAPLVAALALTLTALGGCPGPSKDHPADTVPFPAKGGVKQGLLLSELTSASGGWTVCAPATTRYNATLAAFEPTLAGSCAGKYLMLACGPEGADALNVAAADERAVIIVHDVVTPPVPRAANGVSWYWDDGADSGNFGSIGFAPAGATVTLAGSPQCDYDLPANEAETGRRLCWSTDSGELIGGFRCGADGTPDLPFSAAWSRYVLVHD